IDGDATGYSSVTVYTESNFRMVVSPEDASVTIGDYYGVKEGVIHGHWKAMGGNMERLYFSRESGEAFDLNYYVLTTNSEYGGAPATGAEDTYIIASKNGVTESSRAKLPAEDWGIDKVREIYLGPEFDGIKTFWFYSEGGTYCFGMDKFYVDLDPPAPSTPDAIVVGSGTVDDLTNESPNDDDDTIPDQEDEGNDNGGTTDDNESVPDSQQDSGQLKTAVRGSGSMNMWWLGLLGLLGAVRHFVLRRRRAAAMMVAGGLSVLPVTPAAAAETCGAEGYDIKRCWYLGAGEIGRASRRERV